MHYSDLSVSRFSGQGIPRFELLENIRIARCNPRILARFSEIIRFARSIA